MAIETDTSQANYFDDFDQTKNFHRILFKPETAVQVRELNQLQTIIQNQIERFGNNIFKRGTIVDGINFIFYDNYPYAKIADVLVNGETAAPSAYVGYFAKNEANLIARIVDYKDGFESSDPDLKTLYLKYVNSGNTGSYTSFSPGQVLTIYDSNSSIHEIDVITRGSGYSNSDTLILTPQLLVNVTSGSFSVGDTITDPSTVANGIVTAVVDETTRVPLVSLTGTVSVTSSQTNVVGTSTTFTLDFSNGAYIALYSNATSYIINKINVVTNNTFMNLTSNVTFTNATATYANTSDSRVYVSYRPVSADLSNTSSTSNSWMFTADASIQGSSVTNLGTIVDVIGENAAATLTTDSVGRINTITVTNRGNGYTRVPVVSVKTEAGASANLIAYNYKAQATIASLADSIGSGYAFGVTEGIIYQKGFFIRVEPQTVIVEKYSRVPDDVTVGFETTEEIIDSNEDTSLLDNVLGFDNFNAPGADRLKLTPTLVVANATSAAANTEFFNLVDWSDGYPYRQNSRTVYAGINDQRAEGIKDQSGSFVVDRFLVTTTAPANTSITANTVAVVIDPGTAYVDGYKVQSLFNYSTDVSQAVTTRTEENSKISLNYDNYVRINEVGGFFEFDSGNEVQLYSSAKGFLSNNSLITAGNTTPQGTQIGTARTRNFVYEQGTPGSPNAVYRLYLFDIVMNSGKNFRDVKSVYYDGSVKGIADVVLTADSSTSSNIATVVGRNNRLLFPIGYDSPLVSNNINYTYRTIDETQDVANTGIVTISLTGSPTKTFPYSGTLSDAQKSEIYLVPQANLVAQANLNGTVNVTSTSTTVTGNATDFVTALKAGQYININGGVSNNIIRRIVSIANATSLTIDANAAFTGTTVPFYKAWPKNVPIELQYNTSYSANVNVSGDVMNINLGSSLNTASNTDVIVAYNVENNDPSPTTKTPNRNLLVKLRLANNATTTIGPWCLGVPDVFRLRNVYVGNSTVSSSSTNVTDNFFVDNNQNANYYNLAYLYKKNSSGLNLTDDHYLLVEFDAFTASPGFYTVASYVSSNATTRFTEDSKQLSDLSSTISSFEIPEVFDDTGRYYDLTNQVDFRPYVTATANVTSNTSQVTLNPANTVAFASTDRFFPVPDSIFRHDVEHFVPRIDSVVLDKSGKFRVLTGSAESNTAPKAPAGTMLLNAVYFPPYPALPSQVSDKQYAVLDVKVYSNKYAASRIQDKQIRSLFTEADFALEQPPAYTEVRIGQLERRIRNLEYYVAFNLLQNNVKDRVIPSSLSPNIDRFKYGFYVDDFEDEDFSDVNSPEYAASTIDNYATPLMLSFNMVHTGDAVSANYVSEQIVFQGSATSANTPSNPTDPQYTGGMTIEPDHFKSQSYTVKSGSSSGSSTSSSGTKKSGGKIVCTAMNEAYGFGSFRQSIWLEHSATMHPAYERGYHTLFLPIVDWLYKSSSKDSSIAKFTRRIVERIARKRTADIWKSKRGKIDVEGRVYRTVLEPLCFVVGFIKRDENGRK